MTPNVDNLSKTNLYIRGLQSTTKDEDLYNMCRDFGHISSTKAIIDKATGCCRGYGFVEFIEPKSAELAVKELTKSGVQAQMAKISTSHYNSHQPNQNHSNNFNVNNNPNNNNINTNNNNKNASANIATNINNNNNNNDGDNASNITSSSNQNNGGQVNNAGQVNTNPHSKVNYSDPTNLYIANLPPNMTEQELQNLLSNYGSVVSTRILRDQSNVPRGVGFARMETREKCEQIIKLLNGKPVEGCKEPLLLKFADSGNKKRRPHVNHQHQHQNQHHNTNVHNKYNNNNHQRHKSLQDDSRWRDSSNTSDIGSFSSLEHQTNTSHSDHLSDLAMMAHMSYPRMQPGFPPNAVSGGTFYPNTLVSPSTGPQWIPGGPGQPYVNPQQVIQSSGLGPSSQPSAAAIHYGHMSQLAYQMQGVQIGHHDAGPVGGYMPPQHQWSSLWSQPIAASQQAPPQDSIRLPLPMQQQPAPAPVLLPSQQQQ